MRNLKLTEEEILPDALDERVEDDYAFERLKSNWDIAVAQNEIDNAKKADTISRNANI